MESELTRFNEEQARANRFDIISRMADDLAHEIKNPLNSIVINLEVLKVRAARGDSAAALERAAVVEQEARRLHVLLDRLLQLLRPDRDPDTRLALDQIMDEVLPLVEAQVRLARNEFRSQGSAAVVVSVRRDALRFALLNLLMGAHELLGENGGALCLDCETDDAVVRFTVSVERAAAGTAPAGAQEEFERAVDIAGALLASAGGIVSRTPAGVIISLPRSTTP